MSAGEDPRRTLARHGLGAKKSWGQNFLRDRSVLARIAGATQATADDVVVEIGAGLGALTRALAELSPPPAQIVAIERDPDMVAVLEADVAGEQVVVRAADATHFDFTAEARRVGRPLVVVGNLPYQIASALILALLAAGRAGAVARAVVMIQREMAKRITAPPGSRVYGRLTVAVAQHAEAAILFDVKPGSFHPAPSVMSSVLRLIPRAGAAGAREGRRTFRGGRESRRSRPAARCCAARWRASASSGRRPRWRRRGWPAPSAPRSSRSPPSPAWPTGSPRPPDVRCRSCPKSRPSFAAWTPSCGGGASRRSGAADCRCTSIARSTCARCGRWPSGTRSGASGGAASTCWSRRARRTGSSSTWA